MGVSGGGRGGASLRKGGEGAGGVTWPCMTVRYSAPRELSPPAHTYMAVSALPATCPSNCRVVFSR